MSKGSQSYGDLCSVALKLVFGRVVQKVGECLFAVISRTLSRLVKDTELDYGTVKDALRALIKYNLVTFERCDTNYNIGEYSLDREAVIWLLYMPRCINLIKTKYDDACMYVMDGIFKVGSITASEIIVGCMCREDNEYTVEEYRDAIVKLIENHYLIRLPAIRNAAAVNRRNYIPEMKLEPHNSFKPVEMDLDFIKKVLQEEASMDAASDADILWKANFKRFQQDIRDQIMVGAIERKLGKTAAECFEFILEQMYGCTDPWFTEISNRFSYRNLKSAVERKSKNAELIKYLNQYVKLIVEDKLGFLQKVGDRDGGEYIVTMRQAFDELAMICIEEIITESFGSKTARIFRVVRTKKFLDQEAIHKEALMSAKEAKALTYELFTAQYLHIQTLRKSGTIGHNVANKGVHIFCIKHSLVVKMTLLNCYKTVNNLVKRKDMETIKNSALINKGEKVDATIEELKKINAAEDYVNEIAESITPPERALLENLKARFTTLTCVNLSVLDTIFLFEMYLLHSANPIAPTTSKAMDVDDDDCD